FNNKIWNLFFGYYSAGLISLRRHKVPQKFGKQNCNMCAKTESRSGAVSIFRKIAHAYKRSSCTAVEKVFGSKILQAKVPGRWSFPKKGHNTFWHSTRLILLVRSMRWKGLI